MPDDHAFRGSSRAVVLVMLLACRSGDPAPSPTPGSSAPSADGCTRACEAAGSCLLAPDDCIARCRAEPEVRACLTVAETTDCAAAARCLMTQFCGTQVPRGEGRCVDALSCARSCQDLACVCSCAVAAHPRHTLVLARAGQCVVNCNFEEPCAKARCLAILQACAIQ